MLRALFNHYTPYTENYGITSVVFGAEAPLLETELNETQEIIKAYNRLLLKGLFPNQQGVFNQLKHTYRTQVFEISDNIFYLLNQLIYVKNSNIEVYDGDVYLGAKEIEVTYQDALREHGYLNGDELENYLLDSRFKTETSRRKAIVYNLFTDTGDESFKYLKLGIIEDGIFIVQVQILSVQSQNIVNPEQLEALISNYINQNIASILDSYFSTQPPLEEMVQVMVSDTEPENTNIWIQLIDGEEHQSYLSETAKVIVSDDEPNQAPVWLQPI